MKKIIFLIFVFSLLSCESKSQDKEAILEGALNSPQLYEHFFTNLESRHPYYLIKNKYINPSDTLYIKGIPLISKELKNIPNENYIKLFKFSVNENKASLVLYYKIENENIYVDMKKIKGKWIVTDKRVLET